MHLIVVLDLSIGRIYIYIGNLPNDFNRLTSSVSVDRGAVVGIVGGRIDGVAVVGIVGGRNVCGRLLTSRLSITAELKPSRKFRPYSLLCCLI